MNINRDLAEKLLNESPSFRSFVLDTLFAEDFTEKYRSDVLNALKTFNTAIDRVKYIRSLSVHHLRKAFPDYEFTTNPGSSVIDLKSAKFFSDKYS